MPKGLWKNCENLIHEKNHKEQTKWGKCDAVKAKKADMFVKERKKVYKKLW